MSVWQKVDRSQADALGGGLVFFHLCRIDELKIRLLWYLFGEIWITCDLIVTCFIVRPNSLTGE